MALPKQVRLQIADASRIESELRAAQALEPPAPAEPATPAMSAEPPAEPPAEPVVAAPAPVQPSAPQPDAQYAELLQQHRSLQGIHRTLTRTNSELQSQVQTLQASIQTLQADVDRFRQQATAAPATQSGVTPEEVQEFGPDLISVIERKAREIAAPLNESVAQLKARNAELEQSLGNINRKQTETAEATAEAMFSSRLAQLVPDLNALNYDQNFLAWLSQTDVLDAHGQTLQQRLDEAVRAGNADAAARFFNTFRSLNAPVAAPAATPKPSLAAQAQPVSRAAPDSGAQAPLHQWKQADITAFYDGVTRGKYSPQEKARIEREIFTASRENRVAA